MWLFHKMLFIPIGAISPTKSSCALSLLPISVPLPFNAHVLVFISHQMVYVIELRSYPRWTRLRMLSTSKL